MWTILMLAGHILGSQHNIPRQEKILAYLPGNMNVHELVDERF